MKKTLAMLLMLVLLVAAIPLNALAAGVTAVEDTLILGLNAEPTHLAGILQSISACTAVSNNIYETLVVQDVETNQLVPGLAESWEQVDETTWKFNIRQGVAFHNGTTLTAEDCLFSIQNSTFAWMWGAIDRENSYCEDEYTLVIKTYDRYPALLAMLSCFECAIVCKSAWEEVGEDVYSRNPIGTGPYKFVEWIAGDSITLVKNENYWGQPGYFTNVVYRIITDDTTRSLSLEGGEIDIALDLPASQVDYLEMTGTVDIINFPSMTIEYLGYNCQVEPFNDARVRQALLYALDMESMVRIAYGVTGTLADGICSPTFVDYLPATEEYTYTQNIEKAKALLAEAGYPDGFECTIMSTSKQARVDMVEMIQNAWAQIGVTVNVYITEAGNFWDEVRSGEWEIYYGGWVILANDGDLIHDTFYSTESLWYNTNYTAYVNPEFDAIVDEARGSTDPEERKALYGELQNLIRKELPMTPAVWINKVNGIRNTPTGYVQNPSNYPQCAYIRPVEE